MHRDNLNFFIASSATHLRAKCAALDNHAQVKLSCQAEGSKQLLEDRELTDLLIDGETRAK
jgi:hypothetical protein